MPGLARPGPAAEDSERHTGPPGGERRRAIIRVLLWVLVPNLAVAAAKLAYGLVTGTLSATSDGVHSLLDGAGNLVGIVAVTVASRPADPGHPYGHRKFETLAALAVAALLGLASFAILRGAWERLAGESPPPPFTWIGLVVILATMAVNLIVSRMERAAGRRLGSEFLLADAAHTASDLYASTSVLIAMIGLAVGLTWLDPICAVLIVGFLGWAAWRIIAPSAGLLADAAAVDPSEVERIAVAIPGVLRTHSVRSRGGPGSVFVDLHLEVSPAMPTLRAHELAHEVETALRRELHVADVVVHIEPEDHCREAATVGSARSSRHL